MTTKQRGLTEAQGRGQTANHICQFGDWELKLCPMCRCMTNHDQKGCLKCAVISQRRVSRCVDDDY